MKRIELVDTIKEDEDFFYFVQWCLRIGIRQILKDIDRGVENRATQRFEKIERIYGISKSILKEDV